MATSNIKVGPDPKLEKLYFMRELTRKTGILHEIQVMNLNNWPLVFTHAQEVVTQFSYENKLVAYEIVKVKGRVPANLRQRLEHLEKCVKMLLGDEYSITVFEKGEMLYPEKPHDKRNRNPKGRAAANPKGARATRRVARKA